MQDDQDYYTILGVSRDASVVDIRRAYRALAKSLHPDSLSAGSQTPPAHDFRAVTEAYETLKDEGRRRDYDEELNSARQLASRGRQEKKPGRAFAAGLTIGILVAVGAIGAKIYLDRAGSRASVAKSQDSLRARKADQVVSANVPARDAPSEPKDDTPLEAREAMAEPPAENPIGPAESPSAKTLSPGPVNPGSFRRFDLADGIYLGGILGFNGNPTQYVQFNNQGMTLADLNGNKVVMNNLGITLQSATGNVIINNLLLSGQILGANGAAYSGNIHTTGTITGDTDVIAGGKSGKTHVHGGVTPGSGSSAPPT